VWLRLHQGGVVVVTEEQAAGMIAHQLLLSEVSSWFLDSFEETCSSASISSYDSPEESSSPSSLESYNLFFMAAKDSSSSST
jgi:hypothetical protein